MEKKVVIMEVTEEEAELLAAVRNYNKSFPDGYPQLLWYAQELFDNMLRQPYIWNDTQKYRNMEELELLERPVVVTDMKKKLKDVLMAISWREFANTYFQRSSSWFYHKMDGIDGNGGKGGFNEEEVEQMRGALIDLSNRIRRAAENI